MVTISYKGYLRKIANEKRANNLKVIHKKGENDYEIHQNEI